VLDVEGVQEITSDLADATTPSATLLVIAPAQPRLAASVSGGVLAVLAVASHQSSLLILGGSHDMLTAFRGAGVQFTPFQSAKALEALRGNQSAIDAGNTSIRSLSSVVGLPSGSADYRLLVLVVIAGLALGGIGLYTFRIRPGKQTLLDDPSHPLRRPQVRPRPRATPRRPRPVLPSVAGLRNSGRAIVRTELEPHGYVDLAGCLRRVRWAEPGLPPPAPGERVEVRSDGGELIALAGGSSANGRRP
jgi:hypothetical protein